ncbi:MAG: phosphopantetheine-binding protein [Tepidisphaeraceae bacterium]
METGRSAPEILRRVVTILRRDLKLGDGAAIPPDMPFFGGDIDLDSLDILLLVTSVEKEFGVKIPSSDVGKEIFRNVSTLVEYVQQHLTGVPNAGSPASTGAAPPPIDYLSRLPHGESFRFVTKVTTIREGESADAVWSLKGNEPFFAGHFPGNPLVPGVLLAEALAQVSGLASPPAEGGGVLAHVDVRFEHPVVPPADVTLRSKLTRTFGGLQQFDVSASVAGSVVASGSITLHRAGKGSAGSAA